MTKLFRAAWLLVLANSMASASALDVSEAIQASLPNTPITSVVESVIPGIYTVRAGDNLFYYSVEQRVLIFGEMYSLNTGFVTEHEKDRHFQEVLERHKKDALYLNPQGSGATVIEFLSLTCSSCVEYSQYMATQHDIKRIVFFVESHPRDQQKINHLLCSKTPGQDLRAIQKGTLRSFSSCDKAKQKRSAHNAVVSSAGVNATPTILLNGTRIEGFDKETLSGLL